MNVSPKAPSNGQVLARFLFRGCLALVTGLLALQANARVVEISAVFAPDPVNPTVNKFKNTTPNTGLCNEYPNICNPRNLFSISLGFEPLTQFPILANHTDIRAGAMIKVPAGVRNIRVTNDTGESVDVEFSIMAFSGTIRTRDLHLILADVPVMPTVSANAHNLLWNGGGWGGSTASPCIRAVALGSSWADANFFWFTPVQAPCAKSPTYEIDWLRLRNASVAYLMTAPDPLSMGTGIYRGSITYAVGPGGDFDFGDNLSTSETSVTFNLTLEVQHTLKFQYPAGYDRVVLNPAGGWQQWLDNGRRPEALKTNQPFSIWSSTPFSIELQCEYPVAMQCGIKNPAGNIVAVETRVTLPTGLNDAAGQAVNRRLLSTIAEQFSPSRYVDNGRAALHFEVEREEVANMINAHSGSTYKGNIAVIWDSEIR